jgi:hypothetical protein
MVSSVDTKASLSTVNIMMSRELSLGAGRVMAG